MQLRSLRDGDDIDLRSLATSAQSLAKYQLMWGGEWLVDLCWPSCAGAGPVVAGLDEVLFLTGGWAVIAATWPTATVPGPRPPVRARPRSTGSPGWRPPRWPRWGLASSAEVESEGGTKPEDPGDLDDGEP